MKIIVSRISATLFLLSAMSTIAPAQTLNSQGIALAPGEKLVSVNGVPVQRGNNGFAVQGVNGVFQQGVSNNMALQTGVSLAQSKANRMASTGTMRHLGGGFGGGSAEGVGMGSTRDAAIRNCCFWGQRTPIDIGVASNGSRWYACVIYR